MSTTAPRRSFVMVYRAEDFPLYVLSLLLPGLLIVPALPYRSLQILLIASLLYLAVFFLLRHGAKLEWRHFFSDVFEGVTRYPGMLVRNWIMARDAILPIIAVFALALTGEYFLRPFLAGTFWLKPFPWQWVVWGAFLLITAFRVTIFIAHLLRTGVVREVLQGSTQKKTIAVFPMHQHVLHAFITGMIAHLSVVAPCVLFFMWTDPTYIREALLIAGWLLWALISKPLRKRKLIISPGLVSHRLVYHNHSIAHRSRFFFTVFHGHHHDAIPSALIGSAGGTGFFENIDRGFSWLDFLNSAVVMQFLWTYSIVFDMVVHQYIPGVFPFAKITVIGRAHHITHHYGSALPLGLIFDAYIEKRDLENGYKPDNHVTRWFLDEVERREGLDPELRRKFLTLNDTYVPPAVVPTMAVPEQAPAV